MTGIREPNETGSSCAIITQLTSEPLNLAERIIPRDKEMKQRKRITLPGDKPGTAGLGGIVAYRAIWTCASDLSSARWA